MLRLNLNRPQVLLVASLGVLAAVALYRFVLTSPPTPQVTTTVPNAASADLTDAQSIRSLTGSVDTAGAISNLQERIKQNPDVPALYSQLGWSFLQRARENADPTNYVQAQQAFDAALKQDPQELDALLGQGSLALSRHQFAEAIAWGEKARAINPYRAQIYGIIGDGEVELGRYDAATATMQKMVDTRPDLNSYSRVSYIRELNGDTKGAIEAMERAVQSGNPRHEGTLWSIYQLGNLYFNSGDLAKAEEAYAGALNVKPDYIYARAGMAKVWAAQGQTQKAIDAYRKINEELPLPEFVIALGDLYAINGNEAEAKTQFDLVRVIQKLNADAAMNVDMELALFEADHLPNPTAQAASNADAQAVVTRARAAYEHRASIYAADVLAWALYKAGQFDEAAKYSSEALRLGTRDATLHFHAGMIALARNDKAAAKQQLQAAISINPHFSVRYQADAKAALASLS